MRVMFVSTSYPHDESDWRGVFIRHLTYALARNPDVDLNIWAPPGTLPDSAKAITTQQEAEWLGKLMASGGISHLMRSKGIRSILAPLILIRMLRHAYLRFRDVDIYHLNWLQCALPLTGNRKPALITVLGNDLKLLRLPLMRTAIRMVARKRKVMICPNAEWMSLQLQIAFGDVAKILPISFGIDHRWYSIERTIDANSPQQWLAVSRLTADKLGPLFEWSRDYFCGNSARELHLFGPMQENIVVPEWVHYHGSASPDELASKWFPSATGLITLSRHFEGRPQVMLEAMASGLPIVASRMPAHVSIVHDGVTGVLCDTADEYVQALCTVEDHANNARFSQASRNWARQQIGTWDDCAQRYITAYRLLIEEDSQ